MIETKMDPRGEVQRNAAAKQAKPAAGDNKKGKPKKDDIPFPVVYFGTIAVFLLLRGDVAWNNLASLEVHLNSTFMPKLEAMVLPLLSFFFVCPFLYFWRKLVKGIFFSYVARSWAGLEPGTHIHEKFCEQAWLAVHYSLSTGLGFLVLRNKPWFPPLVSIENDSAIMGSRADREGDHNDRGLQVYYCLQLGFYALELVTLIMSKHRRSDAVVYFFHHIFTLYLMAFSWVSYNQRIGTLVLFLHDIGDIFLPIGKCYSYAEAYIRKTKTPAEYQRHKAIGMASFVMFVIMFAIPRLIVYGGMIYRGFTEYQYYRCAGYDASTKQCIAINEAKHDTPLFIVLGLLYPMHVYWFYLIVKMAIRLVLSPGEYEDVRSDDEKDD